MRELSVQSAPESSRVTGENPALEGDTLPIQAIQSSLERVLSSRTFHAAQGQRIFLRYIVEQSLAGRGHLLKEYVIGTEALGRGESFDPRLDPIVRTQARKLRARLEKYYESEGQNDTVRIDFPKGSYVTEFRSHVAACDIVPVAEPAKVLEKGGVPQVGVLEPIESDSVFTAVKVHWRLAAVAAIGLILCVSIFEVAFHWRYGSRQSVAPTDGASLAVLPFVNLGGIKESEFLSDGMTDELIESLRTIRGLQVVAHTSAFRFKVDSQDLGEIGTKLHVRSVLVGSVSRSDDRLKVSVQLNSVPNGYHLWTGSYDRKLEDARAIEVEIAKSVASVLGMPLTRSVGGGQELTAMIASRTAPNPIAYESYLKGLYFWNKLTADGLRTATGYFEEAISEDPSFARAYTALADCYVMAPQLTTAPPLEVASKIRNLANKAIDLDDSLGEAHIDLAVSAEYEFDWARAESEFQKGLSLSPGNAIGHLWYAKYLAIVGRKSEVLTQRRLAVDLDPVSAYAAQSVAGYFSVMGNYDAAISQFQNALALEPNLGLAHQGLGFTYILAGRRSEGLQELKLAHKAIGDPRRMALVAYAYAVCGQTDYAQSILDGFLQQAQREPFPALAIADVYIGLGDKDRAFQWLDKAIDQRDINLDLKWDPLFQPVRPDPRYIALLRRMKLS